MGNIMISVDDEKEKEIRKYAQELNGGKKGSLSDFVWLAINQYILTLNKEHEREIARQRMLNRMRKGLDIGYLEYTKRSDLYGHRIKDAFGH